MSGESQGYQEIASYPPSVGSRIEVYWPLENNHFPGTVQAFETDGRAHVVYDDGDQEMLNPSDEQWRFAQNHTSGLVVQPRVIERQRTQNETYQPAVDVRSEHRRFKL